MHKGICYIAGAGDCSRLLLNLNDEDFVIAVDGGYEYLKENRIDLVVGDFDSLSYVPEHPNVILLKPEKNDTDMMVALKEGLQRGYECFYIYGGCGGRFDHTYANIQSLAYLAGHAARGYLIHEKQVVTMIQNGSMTFHSDMKGYLSVFAYGEKAEGVTLKGLKYPLEDAVLTDCFPLGVSNEFTGVMSEITVKAGRLLIVYETGINNNDVLQTNTAESVPAGLPVTPTNNR